MAFTKISPLPEDWTLEPDDLNTKYTAAQIKALLNSNPAAIKTFLDSLVDALTVQTAAGNVGATPVSSIDATANTVQTILNAIPNSFFTKSQLQALSGAGLIGATAPSGLTGNTVQAILDALKTAIDQTVLGQIPDGSLTDVKLATDIKVGSLASLTTTNKASVTGAVNELKSAQDTHTANTTTPHGATASAIANTIALRDANGNVVSALPVTNGYNPNILFNPTFNLGSSGWSGIGINGFSVVFGNAGGGSYLWNPTSASGFNVNSGKIPIIPSTTLTLSGEMFATGVTAGNIQLQVNAYDSSDVFLGQGYIGATNGTGWTKYSTQFTTPANTSYVRIFCYMSSGITNTGAGWRKIKLEAGSIATTFSDDNTLNTVQYASVLPLLQSVSGGNKVQSGSIAATAAGSFSVTFPTAFATTPVVKATYFTNGNAVAIVANVTAKSTTGATFYISSGYAGGTIEWEAIGT